MRKLGVVSLAAFVGALILGSSVWAAKLNDRAALAGLHQAKAVFLVNMRQPMAVAHLMTVIGKTVRGLQAQHVRPHLIVVFIGPDVAFLTRDRRGIPYMDERAVAGIQRQIRRLVAHGVQFQACGIALHGMDVHPTMLMSQVTAVGNGFISVIGYQEKGYALVPVY